MVEEPPGISLFGDDDVVRRGEGSGGGGGCCCCCWRAYIGPEDELDGLGKLGCGRNTRSFVGFRARAWSSYEPGHARMHV
jgi:hypothetical protein